MCVCGKIKTIWTTALLKSVRILRRFLETREDLLLPRPQRKNARKTRKKYNNNNNNNNNKISLIYDRLAT